MKILIIGAGGVGTSAAMIISRAKKEGEWAEKVVISDYNFARAEEVAKLCGGGRFVAEKINAKDRAEHEGSHQKAWNRPS